MGLTKSWQLAVAAILMFCNFFGCMVGIVATPDTPFVFMWTLALHEAAAALTGNPRRWLTAGAVTALGLWSKYAMLLIGPVFLWALIRKRGALKSPWPYCGGLLCLLLFLPHLYWNARNGWVTFNFQFHHGVAGSYEIGDAVAGTDLPPPLPQDKISAEFNLGRFFLDEKVQPPKVLSPIERVCHRVLDFIGGQLLLWGGLLIPLSYGIFWRLRHKIGQRSRLDPALLDLCAAATLFPLFLFGFLSFFQKVEANWPAIHTVGASIILAAALPRTRRFALPLAAAVNLALILGLVWHARSSFWTGTDRVVTETHGYDELTRTVIHTLP